MVAAFLVAAASFVSAADCPPITPSPDWKGDIEFPADPFRVDGTGFPPQPGWVKFTILTCDRAQVYFQDGRKYAFHYDFARERLDPFYGISRTEFDSVTLYAENRRAVLGAVVLPPLAGWPPRAERSEYGIQLVGMDPYEPAEALEYLNLVKGHVSDEPDVRVFYFPTFEQAQTANENAEFFEANGFPVASADKWAEGNACYSQGWAIGRLLFIPAEEIGDAFLNGSLTPVDILLTDGVPADTPLVSGIITLAPAAPNSHTAILAQTFGVPFAYLRREEDADRAQTLVGHLIVLRAYKKYESTEVRLIDLEGQVTDERT